MTHFVSGCDFVCPAAEVIPFVTGHLVNVGNGTLLQRFEELKQLRLLNRR